MPDDAKQGYYDVTLHTGPGLTKAHATFPFGRWAEIGYWLDEQGAGEKDTASITFHPLRPPLHSVRAELHEAAAADAVMAATFNALDAAEFGTGLGEIDAGEED